MTTKPATLSSRADLQIAPHDGIFLLRGRTTAALAWLEDNTPAKAVRLGPAIGVERGIALPLIERAVAAGLCVVML